MGAALYDARVAGEVEEAETGDGVSDLDVILVFRCLICGNRHLGC